jgi:hypothetical protein
MLNHIQLGIERALCHWFTLEVNNVMLVTNHTEVLCVMYRTVRCVVKMLLVALSLFLK